MRTEDEIIEIIAHVVERHCTAYARQKTHSPNEIPMWESVKSELKDIYRIKVNREQAESYIDAYLEVCAQRINALKN